jgi:hypothetical protein
MSTPASQEPLAWSQILKIYRHELVASGLMAFVHIVIVYILFYSLKEYFGTSLGLLLAILIFLSPLLLIFAFVLFMRYVAKKFVIIPLMLEIDKMIAAHKETLKPDFDRWLTKQSGAVASDVDRLILVHHAKVISEFEERLVKYESNLNLKIEETVKVFGEGMEASYSSKEIALLDKIEERVVKANRESASLKFSSHENLREKYNLKKDWHPVIDFTSAEVDAVKLELMNKVEDRVSAIHWVESPLPLPLEKADDQNYFDSNKGALERIRSKHHNPTERQDYSIHRIFIVTKTELADLARRSKIMEKIHEHHEAKFDIRIAFKEDLKEVPRWEFAIFDDEIALRLSLDKDNRDYGEGSIYIDEHMVHKYRERFNTIRAKSYEYRDFCHRFLD